MARDKAALRTMPGAVWLSHYHLTALSLLNANYPNTTGQVKLGEFHEFFMGLFAPFAYTCTCAAVGAVQVFAAFALRNFRL